MPNMIEAQVVQYHRVPVTVQQLLGNMPRHIIIHFCKVLHAP